MKIVRINFVGMMLLGTFFIPVITFAATLYDFNADTVGIPPSEGMVLGGSFEVANQATLGNSLRATSLNANNIANIWLTDAENASDYSVTWKEAYSEDSGRHGFVLRSQPYNSLFSSDLKSGYLFQVNHNITSGSAAALVSKNTLRIYAFTAAATSTQLAEFSLTATSPRWFRASVLGDELSFEYSNDGTNFTLATTTTDLTFNSGGVQYTAGFAGATNVGKDYVDDIVIDIPDSISITTPNPYQVIQRGETSTADININGTYTGNPSAIEASWNGTPYQTIDSSPSDGSFSGTLENQLAGQGSLSVRFVNDTDIATSTAFVGVGDIFVIAGQSNASGRGFSSQTYNHASLHATLFGNNDEWKNLADPIDSNTGQIDSVSSDAAAAGSVWPLIATQYLADKQIPVAFIPTAKGGTSIQAWQPNTATSTLYGSMARRITAAGGSIRAVLFFQGESDAQHGIDRTTYVSGIENFANNVYADFNVRTIVGQIGNNNYPATSTDAIRLAQIDAWNNGSNILSGPALHDVNLADEGGDSLHFKSNTDLQIFANRWWASIQKGLFGGVDARGPRLVSAHWFTGDSRFEILLTFTDETLPLLPASDIDGFVVKDGGVPVTISSVTRVTDGAIKIVLTSPTASTTTVSFASGGTGVGASLLTDSSALNLPAEVFIDQEVTVDSTPVISTASQSSRSGQTRRTPSPNANSVIGSGSRNSDLIKDLILTNRALFMNAQTQGIILPAFILEILDLSTGNVTARFSRSLALESTGPDVSALQQILTDKGFYTYPAITGYYGPVTLQAVADYQKSLGLEPLGYVGPATRAALNAVTR